MRERGGWGGERIVCVCERECHVCALLVHTSSAYFDETCEEDLIMGENVP